MHTHTHTPNQSINNAGAVLFWCVRVCRSEAISAFNSHEKGGHDVFLLTLKSNSKGLDLPTASRIIFLEPPLDPSENFQAICRGHRSARGPADRPLKVYYLTMR